MPTRRLAVLLLALAGIASALAQETLDDRAAATKFLQDDKGLLAPLPAEQWFATYAGPYWTAATLVSVIEKDDLEKGLRKITIERIATRDERSPARETCSWWIDSSGAFVKGERRSFEEGSPFPQEIAKLAWRGKQAIKIEATARDPNGRALPSDPVENATSPLFVPDPILPLVLLPSSKGSTWRFQTWGGNGLVEFTITDQGSETVPARHGDVSARKLVLKDVEGELTSWVDSEKRIVLQRFSLAPDLVSVAGTDSESRTDWLARPKEEADENANFILTRTGPSSEINYGIYDPSGHAKEKYHASITKDVRQGKTFSHFLSSTAAIGTTTITNEEWWIAEDAVPTSGSSTLTIGAESHTTTASVDSGTYVLRTDESRGKEEVRFPVAPRFVPDALLLLKGLARVDKGAYRFSGVDLRAETPYSILIVVEPTLEQVRSRGAVFKGRRMRIHQNNAVATGWVDLKGTGFVVQWSDGELFVSGTPEECAKDLAGPVGPLPKEQQK